MIKDFSVLYAGHVLEGDGIGFDGIPANDRWYDNDRLSMALDIAREAAVFLDDLGFDILWMAEHHFQREGYECIPNLLIMSQYLAQHTNRIKFGCGFNILPMWHPHPPGRGLRHGGHPHRRAAWSSASAGATTPARWSPSAPP